MAHSKGAAKLLSYLGLYKITATEYSSRIDGTNEEYNVNWFIGNLDKGGEYGRHAASPQKGLFKTALAELVSGGY